MSIIKGDGGTQYIFLESIHYGCALILHSNGFSKIEKTTSSSQTIIAEGTTSEVILP